MSDIWTFHSAGQIVFGPRSAAQVGQIATRLGLQRVCIVTDEALIAAGLLDGVRGSLIEAGIAVEVFEGDEPEPSLAAGESCIKQARRYNADGILGLGGGSNMDLAKAAATVVAHGGTIRDYVGDDQVPGPVLPLICLPTTAGTGSEVTFAAVLTDTENELKVPILSNYIRPAVAIVDPQLTLSCPAKVTADSGIDALTHAIEAYTAIDNRQFPIPEGEKSVYQGGNPLSTCLAEQAITLIGKHLMQAVNEPNNLMAREAMALAATLAGLAFANSGVALVHALQRQSVEQRIQHTGRAMDSCYPTSCGSICLHAQRKRRGSQTSWVAI